MLPQHTENPFPKSSTMKNFSCMFVMSMEKKQNGTQQLLWNFIPENNSVRDMNIHTRPLTLQWATLQNTRQWALKTWIAWLIAAELAVAKVTGSFIHQSAFLSPWPERLLSLQPKHKASCPNVTAGMRNDPCKSSLPPRKWQQTRTIPSLQETHVNCSPFPCSSPSAPSTWESVL